MEEATMEEGKGGPDEASRHRLTFFKIIAIVPHHIGSRRHGLYWGSAPTRNYPSVTLTRNVSIFCLEASRGNCSFGTLAWEIKLSNFS